jgi:hypothetical protein
VPPPDFCSSSRIHKKLSVVSRQLSVAKTELALRARPVVFFDDECE